MPKTHHPWRRPLPPGKRRFGSLASKRKANRKNKATGKILEAAQLHRDDAVFKAAKKYLASTLSVPDQEVAKSPNLLKSVLENRIAFSFMRISRINYLKALQIGYAAAELIAAAPNAAELIDIICQKSKANRRTNSDLMSLVLRTVIDYGQNDKGAPDQLSRRLWSRDLNALRYLKSKSVEPGKILEYQKEHRGGVDKWARAWSKIAKLKRQNESDTGSVVAPSGQAGAPPNSKRIDEDSIASVTIKLPKPKPREGMLVLVIGDETTAGAHVDETVLLGLLPDDLEKSGLKKKIRWMRVESGSNRFRQKTGTL